MRSRSDEICSVSIRSDECSKLGGLLASKKTIDDHAISVDGSETVTVSLGETGATGRQLLGHDRLRVRGCRKLHGAGSIPHVLVDEASPPERR